MSFKAPASYETALTEAENASFDVLCRLLNLNKGINAFIGFNPCTSADCMVWGIGALRNDEMVLVQNCIAHNFYGELEIYNRSRSKLQEQLLSIIKLLPLSQDGGMQCELLDGTNVLQLRLNGEQSCLSAIEVKQVTLNVPNVSTEGQTTQLYYATATFDVVIYCGDAKSEIEDSGGNAD